MLFTEHRPLHRYYQYIWVKVVTMTAESLDNALCFHPETLITLEDNTQKCIKDIELGDIIVNGSRVEGIMKLHNIDHKGTIKNNFYK